MTRRILMLCNALDDRTRRERRIATDSPAAARKVFGLAGSVRRTGTRVIVLSYGRGRQDGSGVWHGPVVRRVAGVATVYMPFINRPVLSELVSLLAPVPLLLRFRLLVGPTTVLFYNRALLHVPGLLMARLLRFRTVLDLEDGEIRQRTWSVSGLVGRLCGWIYERVCSGGALLACSSLASMTQLEPKRCYYGTVEISTDPVDWEAPCLRVLFGGTISASTGGELLLEAVRIVREAREPWSESLRLVVTGQGDCVERFRALAAQPGSPNVEFHGRTTDAEYADIVRACHVGLALKPATGPLAHTTFPSKVVELASAGLLVATTPISDVEGILGSGAAYLRDERPLVLAGLLRQIVERRSWAKATADAGQRAVAACCAPEVTGPMLARFLTGGDA